MASGSSGSGNHSHLYYRLRSPVRWLLTLIVVVSMLAVAGMAGNPYLLLILLVAVPAILAAPSFGPYADAPKPIERTDLRLQLESTAKPVPAQGRTLTGMPAGLAVRQHLVLRNQGQQPAVGFNIRIIIPHTIAPPNSKQRLLTGVQVGQPGKHWFIEGTFDSTVVTLRADPGLGDMIVCEPGTSVVLADLQFPIVDRSQYGTAHDLEYQISGGTATAHLDRLRVQFPHPPDD
ncbi:MAG TPA: hypothetical protein VFS96_06355 [Nitrolancea sp.]|nr:hypothetical protein [Nitrolancea sp.]